jgi:hypothetical protein
VPALANAHDRSYTVSVPHVETPASSTKGVVVMKLRVLPAALAAGVLLFATLFFVFSCSDNPTGTGAPPPMEGSGTVDLGAGGKFLLSTVDMGPDFQGVVEVWAYDLTVESDSVVAFDLVIVNGTSGDIPPPLDFVITRIVPNTVTCLNPDGYMRDRLPYFDFSDDLGEDGLLTPGEATAPVHARFLCPEPMAFSIGFRLSIGDVIQRGVIGGIVFEDLNQDGIYDDVERGIPGVPIGLRAMSGDSTGTVIEIVVHTDNLGRYAFRGLSSGVYKVTALLGAEAHFTTPNPLLVALVTLPDGTVSSFLKAHFGVVTVVPPPPPPVVWAFGPLTVGPGSPNGTRVDSTFVIPPPMPPFPPEGDLYYVRVEPAPVMGPYPMYIDEIRVILDNEVVYKFQCPPDTLCPAPLEKVVIDPALTGQGEHAISIRVSGSERSFVLVGIEHGVLRDVGTAGQHR